ncbi:uncharacterized protein LOC111275295 isoform X2 [Durio zibethinus]|uniref:Uncharacterized protein LOC111275295 isoform X2 n=1 Tax=Durio zibethinus TaxID=66656 RepID=A0A6P5WLC4_DURZI|nr:uncharacterized protein LOC111275295 isoform X2 [Durio zibethinus]
MGQMWSSLVLQKLPFGLDHAWNYCGCVLSNGMPNCFSCFGISLEYFLMLGVDVDCLNVCCRIALLLLGDCFFLLLRFCLMRLLPSFFIHSILIPGFKRDDGQQK